MKQKYWIRKSNGDLARGLTIISASDRAARAAADIAMAIYKGPWQLETTDRGSDKIRIVVKHLGKITAQDDENPLNLPF